MACQGKSVVVGSCCGVCVFVVGFLWVVWVYHCMACQGKSVVVGSCCGVCVFVVGFLWVVWVYGLSGQVSRSWVLLRCVCLLLVFCGWCGCMACQGKSVIVGSCCCV